MNDILSILSPQDGQRNKEWTNMKNKVSYFISNTESPKTYFYPILRCLFPMSQQDNPSIKIFS